MEIVILDDKISRLAEIAAALEKNRYKVVQCGTTNDFMSIAGVSSPGLFLIDVESWQRGRSIHDYFQTGKKLEHIPAVFYNAPQNFVSINDRARHEKDYVLPKPSEVDSIVDAVSHTL